MTKATSDHRGNPVPGPGRSDPRPARDLLDFHVRWPEFRPLALEVLARNSMSTAEHATLRALVDLADRVRDNDLMH